MERTLDRARKIRESGTRGKWEGGEAKSGKRKRSAKAGKGEIAKRAEGGVVCFALAVRIDVGAGEMPVFGVQEGGLLGGLDPAVVQEDHGLAPGGTAAKP